MGAGESAEEQAERARRSAEAHERKAARAQRAAENWAKGAAGERAVAAVLAPLEREGWRIVHDLADPEGGNIDHLAVGPPGVAVIDAKNWVPPVTITADRRLVTSKDDRSEELKRLGKRVELIRHQVALDGLQVSVRGYVVLCGDVDRIRESEDLGDLRIVGLDHVTKRLRKAKGDLGPSDVDAVADTLALRLSKAEAERAALRSAAPSDAVPEFDRPSSLFLRAHRLYYLREWSRAGHRRLYLSDRAGTTLGWTDVNTGARQIDATGDDAKFAQALLEAADLTGVKLDPGEAPKVATQLWGGRLLSRMARFHTALLVGQEWKKFGKHRLYGTLIDPGVDSFQLGHIDLKDRTLHPTSQGPIGKDRGPAGRYLGFLLAEMPERSAATSSR